MKAKLLKTAKGHYVLVDDTKETHDKGFLIATSRESDVNKLSLNNCLEIENGYDLSALFCEVDESIDYQEFDFTSFRLGFQKAFEILNNKFSEEDMKNLFAKTLENSLTLESHTKMISDLEYRHFVMDELYSKLFQSLQQNSWNVEVEMEYVGECNGNNGDGCFQDSPAHNCGCFQRISKLDSNRCLILKKI
jgi:hypothetical protein